MPPVQAEQPGRRARGRITAAWRRWFDAQRSRVDNALSSHLNALKRDFTPHSRLLDCVEYALTAGGKRLRPVLVLECCRVCGGTEAAAWPAALAVECVHTFSLIHDDLPAMDDDDLRRGKPTSHKVFGEALAILAGDWLLAHAFALLTEQRRGQRLAAELTRVLATASCEVCLGQGADIAGQQRPGDAELVRFIHGYKTSRLFEACCRLGALSARAQAADIKRMARYGSHLGLAFQIVDDLLDCAGTAERVGKRTGKDAAVAKQTYPAVFGPAASREHARREIDAAVAALAPFGVRARRLRLLAEYVLARDR